ncbi:hypothetical protein GGR57DRAFT_255820 [Xylariaceae sp. FL1272]|nr:hypothetical protein GGR57DRAFT_255820 [Xylariaceae sp. FL1272]
MQQWGLQLQRLEQQVNQLNQRQDELTERDQHSIQMLRSLRRSRFLKHLAQSVLRLLIYGSPPQLWEPLSLDSHGAIDHFRLAADDFPVVLLGLFVFRDYADCRRTSVLPALVLLPVFTVTWVMFHCFIGLHAALASESSPLFLSTRTNLCCQAYTLFRSTVLVSVGQSGVIIARRRRESKGKRQLRLDDDVVEKVFASPLTWIIRCTISYAWYCSSLYLIIFTQ